MNKMLYKILGSIVEYLAGIADYIDNFIIKTGIRDKRHEEVAMVFPRVRGINDLFQESLDVAEKNNNKGFYDFNKWILEDIKKELGKN